VSGLLPEVIRHAIGSRSLYGASESFGVVTLVLLVLVLLEREALRVAAARPQRLAALSAVAAPLFVAGLVTLLIPDFTPPLVKAIVMRHPLDQDIPALWKKLDPVLGSTLVFFLPCFVLAVISPYMIRLAARRLESVGTISGLVYAASTVGSIAGVFVSGYVLIDLSLSAIFRVTGGLILFLAGLSLVMDRRMARER